MSTDVSVCASVKDSSKTTYREARMELTSAGLNWIVSKILESRPK